MTSPTTTTITIPFALNEPCWRVGPQGHEIQVECPECFGHRYVHLVRGDGTIVELECNRCQSGYDPPKGYVKRTVYGSEPVEWTPRHVRMEHGGEFIYDDWAEGASGGYIVHAEDMAHTEEECLARCAERNAAFKAEDERRFGAMGKSKHRSLTHAMHYHRGCIKRAQQEQAYHESKYQEFEARKQKYDARKEKT